MRNSILTMSQWETRVSEMFSMAIVTKASHASLLEMTDKYVYAELNRKYVNGRRVYPSYISGYVQGLMTVHRAGLYRNNLEFCYLYGGVIYSTHKDSTRRSTEEFFSSNNGHLLNDAEGAHYWKNSDNKF